MIINKNQDNKIINKKYKLNKLNNNQLKITKNFN